MFNLSKEKKQKFSRVIVFWMVIGLVGAYIPLLFVSDNSNSPDAQNAAQPSQQASLPAGVKSVTSDVPVTVESVAASTTTSTASKKSGGSVPSGFSGLQEEGKSLDDLNKQLGQ